MRLWIVVLVTACSGGAKTAAPPAPPAPPAPARAKLTPAAICARYETLRTEECGGFAQMHVDDHQCPEVFRDALTGPDTKDRRVLVALGTCMVDNPRCEGVLACTTQIEYEDASDLRACSDPADSRAVGTAAAEFAKRNGAGVLRYPDAKSSKERPIEMCGISAGIGWLVSLTCGDGSHPLHGIADAEGMRAGNVGAGGRCGSIIDLYRVKCPEATYDVYVDGYICPAPQ